MDREKYAEAKTLTGYDVDQLLDELQKPLPEDAYKPVEIGAWKYTDISPSHTLEVLTRVFGLYGAGWGLEWLPDHLNVFQDGKKYTCTINHARFWFTLGDEKISFLVNGEHSNMNLGYSVRGAITNAIGAGAAKLLFQSFVYRGEKLADQAPQKDESPAYWQLVADAKSHGLDLTAQGMEAQFMARLFGDDAPKGSLKDLADDVLERINGYLDYLYSKGFPKSVQEKTNGVEEGDARKAIGRAIFNLAMETGDQWPAAEKNVNAAIVAGEYIIALVGQEGEPQSFVCGPVESFIE